MVQVIEVPDTAPRLYDTVPVGPVADPALLEYTPPDTATSDGQVLSVHLPTSIGGGGGGLPFTTRTVTADTTAVVGELLQVDASAGEVTVAAPASFAAGNHVTVAKIDSTDHSVIFAAPVFDDPEGAAIVAANAAATFVWDGHTWLIVSVNTSYSGDAALLEVVPEVARDALADALVAGDGITITPDDTADTITVAAHLSYNDLTDQPTIPDTTGLVAQSALDAAIAAVPEQARDALGAALVAGAGISLAVDDTNNQIIITATAGSGVDGVTTEDVQDVVNALLAAGTHSGITFTYDDAGDALSATVTAPSWDTITGKPAFAAVATSGSASDLTGGVLDDTVIPATVARDAELAAHTSDTTNPHQVTKAQVGLGAVDNTSDNAKPVSALTQQALAGKAPLEHNHGTVQIAASGPRNATTFLRGDDTWAVPTFASPGPAGGVQTSGYSPTITPNAAVGTHFRYHASGSMTIHPPSGGVDGQRVLLEILASGGSRTITFSSAVETSAAAPQRSVTIPYNTWGYFALLNRDGTYRLMAMDPIPT